VASPLLPFSVMQGPSRWLAVTGLLISCSGHDTVPPEADAPVGTGGFVVQWGTKPDGSWPLTLDNGATLGRASFAVDNVRVVGDAGPGDPRTTASALTVRWDDNTIPQDLSFSDAPSGLYSQLSMLVDGHLATSSMDLRGTVVVNSTSYEYRIEGDNPLAITIGIDRTLTPPGTTAIKVVIDFKHAVEAIDFSQLTLDGDRYEIDDNDPAMAQFRQSLVESFSVDGQMGSLGLR
jgi:hypothetical protein